MQLIRLLLIACLSLGLFAAEMQLASGFNHTLLLDANGQVWAWGANAYGQLGNDDAGSFEMEAVPVQTSASQRLDDVIAIAAGQQFSVALRADGSVWTWGRNDHGQLGSDETFIGYPVPVVLASDSNIDLNDCLQVSAGQTWAMALGADGDVWTWGEAGEWRGNGGASDTYATKVVQGSLSLAVGNAIAMSAGAQHGLALTVNGTVWAWGINTAGQLGDGTGTGNFKKAILVQDAGGADLSQIRAISAGGTHSLAVDSSGALWAWGSDAQGQFGNGGNDESRPYAKSFSLTQPVRAVAAGPLHSAVLTVDAGVFTAGDNSSKQLGQTTSTTTFSLVSGSSGEGRQLPANLGGNRTLILGSSGEINGFGDGSHGELGNGTTDVTIDATSATVHWNLGGIMQVTGGDAHSIALKADGTVWTWGSNETGQLGDDAGVSSKVPVQVMTANGVELDAIMAIAAGANHNLALDVNGTVYAWGDGRVGQVGYQETLGTFPTAHPVTSDGKYLDQVISIAAGRNHSLAVLGNGQLLAWGNNKDGQIGNGSTANASLPTTVENIDRMPLTGVTCAAGGWGHSGARLVEGSVWTWGSDAQGSLGNGTGGSSLRAIQTEKLSTARTLQSGLYHQGTPTLGKYAAWGGNSQGEVGRGDFISTVQRPNFIDTSAIRSLAFGGQSSFALRGNGSLAAWGDNDFGQLGLTVSGDQKTPQLLTVDNDGNPLPPFASAGAGYQHGLAIDAAGRVWAWGSGGGGRLGNSNADSKPQPVLSSAHWQPEIEINVSDQTAAESNPTGNTARFRISRVGEGDSHHTGTIWLRFNLAGSTAAAGDYLLKDSDGTIITDNRIAIHHYNHETTLTMQAQDDQYDEQDELVRINLLSGDGYRLASSNTSADAIITDNDTAGFVITEVDTSTDETGDTAQVKIHLAAQPENASDTVKISYEVYNTSEGLASSVDDPSNTGTISWDSSDWDVDRTITITGQDDLIDDGDQYYDLVLSQNTGTTDPDYIGIVPPDIRLLNIDNDTAGVTISPSPLTRRDLVEGADKFIGGELSYSIKLDSKPESEVILAFTPSDNSEATVDLSSMTFTSGNWSFPQELIVSVVNDVRDDGDINHRIIVDIDIGDSTYSSLDPSDILLTTVDNDTAGLVFSDFSPTVLQVDEDNTVTATYQVRLATRPDGPVSILLSDVSEPDEITLSSISLNFDQNNWNTKQTVAITAIDDNDIETSHPDAFVSHVASANAGDPYDGDTSSIQVQIIDNDSAGYVVSPTNLAVIEDQGADWFSVGLTAEPSGDIVLDLSKVDPNNEVNLLDTNLNPITQLTINQSNWETGFLVGVSADDDSIEEGQENFSIAFTLNSSDDSHYDSGPGSTVSVTVDDPGTQAILIDAESNTELDVTEGDASSSYSVRLSTDPGDSISVALSAPSDVLIDLPGGGASDWVTSGSISFDTSNWATPQTITVQAINDAIYEVTELVTISHVVDAGGWTAGSMPVRIHDNDTPAVIISPNNGLTVTESGGLSAFNIYLATEPTSNVECWLAINDPSTPKEARLTYDYDDDDDGDYDVIDSPAFIFDVSNWNIPQIVYLIGQEDDQIYDDGDQFFNITTTLQQTTDSQEYHSLTVPPVQACCVDDDTASLDLQLPTSSDLKEFDSTGFDNANAIIAGFTLSTVPYNPDIAAATSAIVTIALDPQLEVEWDDPNDNPDAGFIWVAAPNTISITMQLGDTRLLPGGGTSTWDQVQFRVRAANDAIAEGFHQGRLRFFVNSTDPAYNALATQSMTFNINDSSSDGTHDGDDTADITITPASNQLGEDGSGTTFTVQLESKPQANVNISLWADPGDEAVLYPSLLNIAPSDWQNPVTVWIDGLDDEQADGNQSVTARLDLSSSDPFYNARSVTSPTFSNIDNDVAGLIVWDDNNNQILNTATALTPGSSLVLSEDYQGQSLSFGLNTRPSADVSITLALQASDGGATDEGQLDQTVLTINPDTWWDQQWSYVSGVDDEIADGDQTLQLTMTISSIDTNYNALPVTPIDFVNQDDDVAGIEISPQSTFLAENSTTTFDIALFTEPTTGETITIGLTSSDSSEGTLSTNQVSFTTSNWSQGATVTITGVPDGVADGDVRYLVTTTAASSSLGSGPYQGLEVPDVEVFSEDIDEGTGTPVGVLVEPTFGLSTTEAGGSAQFSVRLESMPAAAVSIDASVDPTTEGSIDIDPIVLDASNWDTGVTVTVTGLADGTADGDRSYQVLLANTFSVDGNYTNLDVPDVELVNQDVDTPNVLLTQSDGTTQVNEDASQANAIDSYDVRLATTPSAAVTIALDGGSRLELSIDNQSSWANTATLPALSDNTTTQTVFVRAAADFLDNGTVDYQLISHSASSSNGNYDSGTSLVIPDIEVAIIDNDVTGISTSTPSGLQTTEAGGTATVNVVLDTMPSGQVELIAEASPNDQVVIDGDNTLTFLPGDWQTAQAITLRGVDPDNTDNGNVAFTLTLRIDQGLTADTDYNDLANIVLNGQNLQVNDAPTITLDTPSPLNLAEDAGTQVINLSNLSTGQAGENQSLRLDAVASAGNNFDGDASLITGLTSNYDGSSNAGNVTFTPAAGRGGSARIDITLRDSGWDGVFDDVTTPNDNDDVLSGVTLLVAIEAINDAPVLTVPGSQSTSEEQTLAIAGVNLTDDATTQLLECGLSSLNQANLLVDAASGVSFINATSNGGSSVVMEGTVAQLNAALAGLQYTGATDWNGTDTVNLSVNDRGAVGTGGALIDNASISVTVAPIDDAPSLSFPETPLVNEDSSLLLPAIAASEADGDTLTTTLEVTVGSLTIVQVAGVTYAEGDGTEDARVVFSANLADTNRVLAGLTYLPSTNNDQDDSLAVSVNDGTTTVSGSLTIDVVPVNDAPSLSITYPGGASSLLVAQKESISLQGVLSASDVEDDNSTLRYELKINPSSGNLQQTLNDGSVRVYDKNGTSAERGFTQAELDTGSIIYQHQGGTSSSDAFAVEVVDAIGARTPASVVDLGIDFSSAPPQISLPGSSSVSYTENDSAVLLQSDSGVTVSDSDSPDFDGGQLSVTLRMADGSDTPTDDQLVISPHGSGPDQIDIDDTQVFYGGTLIGNWSGGQGDGPLVIDFRDDGNAATAAFTTSHLTALLRRLAYVHDGDNPGAISREILFSMQDGDGGFGDFSAIDTEGNSILYGTNDAVKTVQVTPINDAPVGSAATILTSANLAVTGTLGVTDPDSTNFTFTIGSAAAKGTVTITNATAGAFRYEPVTNETGGDGFTYIVTDDAGASSAAATISVHISSADDDTPEITSDPPMSYQDGEQMQYNLTTDTSSLGEDSTLSYQLLGTVPTGMSVQTAADGSTTLTWSVNLDDPALLPSTSGKYKYLKVSILVSDSNSGTSTHQNMLLVFAATAQGDG
jgi:alpha-tubulin suppressor-like RCC1 family protein